MNDLRDLPPYAIAWLQNYIVQPSGLHIAEWDQAQCLVYAKSEMTTMDYVFYQQKCEVSATLGPSWLTLKATKNLTILEEGITWIIYQSFQPNNRSGWGGGDMRIHYNWGRWVLDMDALRELILSRWLR